MGVSVRLCLNSCLLSYVESIRYGIMSHIVPCAVLCPIVYMRNSMYIIHLQTSLHIFYIRHNGYCATNVCLGQRGRRMEPMDLVPGYMGGGGVSDRAKPSLHG